MKSFLEQHENEGINEGILSTIAKEAVQEGIRKEWILTGNDFNGVSPIMKTRFEKALEREYESYKATQVAVDNLQAAGKNRDKVINQKLSDLRAANLGK